jgi:hypothetical protein
MLITLNDALKARGPELGNFPLFLLHPAQILAWTDAVWETWRETKHALKIGGRPLVAKAPEALWRGVPKVSVTENERTAVGSAFHVQLSQGLRHALGMMDLLDLGPGVGASSNHLADIAAHALAAKLNAPLIPPDQLDPGAPAPPPAPVPPLWQHLIYAYLIENTRVVEIMRRVLVSALTDETLGPLSPEAHQWVRATEDLMFRDGPSSLVASTTSWLRRQPEDARYNAFQRMFSMDVNHAAEDGKPYPYVKATVANTQFVRTLQDLLRELWRGYVNAKNQLGPNNTDESAMAELIDQLQIMLASRRLSDGGGYGNLTREELVAVSMMSWFELSLAPGSPIVTALKAEADTPEDRLRKIGERVGIPAHAKSRSFFILAGHLPALLTMIEAGMFQNRAHIAQLYQPGPLRDSVLAITTQWSAATGVNLKEMPATTSAA